MHQTSDTDLPHLPVFEKKAGEWYFYDLDGRRMGPRSNRESIEDLYWNYMAYVVDAPACHHPTPKASDEEAA